MTSRGRAIAFASAAAVCAGLAVAAGEGGAPPTSYGALRDVVVARTALAPRRPLARRELEGSVEVRRVPAAFVPPDAVGSISELSGRRPSIAVPAGGYLLRSQFEVADPSPAPHVDLGPGRRAVEIGVSGAAPLAAGGRQRVDVVVTTQPQAGGDAGRTYVAAEDVVLLALRSLGIDEPASGPQATASWVATLALTRGEALRLIHAQAVARDLRLLSSG